MIESHCKLLAGFFFLMGTEFAHRSHRTRPLLEI